VTSPDALPARAPRVRIAPSPTGDPHVGTAYMSLFNLAFARRHGGSFVLRIEDTDRARFREDSEQQIYDTLRWLGLDWDEGPDKGGPFGPYRQSERLDSYRPHVDRLLADGHAYLCWCTGERLTQMREEQQRRRVPTGYDRLCLGKTAKERAALPGASPTPVVRMRVPDEPPLTFVDLVRGEVSAPRPDDQVLLKADGFPTYHLAVVVDDHLMGITHVVRGEEWISSTPKHLLLLDWLGWERPAFAHMPLLRNTDKSKISKRKNPAARLTWFVEQGYLPEALVNFLGLLGYSVPGADPGAEQPEVFTFAQMSATFDWARVNTVGPVFDLDKLGWLNGHYLRALPEDELVRRVLPFLARAGLVDEAPTEQQARLVAAAVPVLQSRMALLSDAAPLLRPLLAVEEAFEVEPEVAAKQLGPESRPVLEATATALQPVEDWRTDTVQTAMDDALLVGLGLKRGKAYAPVRAAVLGAPKTLPLPESMALLGKERTLRRLRAAAGRAGDGV
jgi:glutamyl-tRNA synthetase